MNFRNKSLSIFTTCPICKCKIREDRLESHKRRLHDLDMQKNKLKSGNDITIWEICPICKCSFRADHIESHKERIHGIGQQKKLIKYPKNSARTTKLKNTNSDIIIVNKSRDSLGYYTVKNGRKFHTIECRFVFYSKIRITEDMLINNYTPCSVCLPDFGKKNGMLPGTIPCNIKSRSKLFTNGAYGRNG